MNKYSLDDVRIKAPGISLVILSIQQITHQILFKTKDNDVNRFLELPVIHPGSDFEPSFIESVILRALSQATQDNYGKGMTIVVSKEVLLKNGFIFSSKADIALFAERLMAQVPQITSFDENGNGVDGEEIYFRIDYDSKIPLD